MRYRIICWMTIVLGCLAVTQAAAQDINEAEGTATTVNSDADELFKRLMPKKDTTYSSKEKQEDTSAKRLSFHTNVAYWLLTVPNFGIEYDLDKTERNNRSILLFGKYNPEPKQDVASKFHFHVAGVRGEFRKYWRTGREGKVNAYYDEYRKLNLHKPDTTWVTDSNYVDGEWVYEKRATFDEENQAIADAYNGNPYKGRFYNRYMQVRRLLSSRTIDRSRNWRAYYLGAYAEYDKWHLSFGSKGKKGSGLSVGATLGWSIPLLTQTFPKEGGLDLDLGLNVGVKMVKYDSYEYRYFYHGYDQQWAETVLNRSKSKESLSIVPFPVVQDLHVSLVYRLRSISRKVSLALVDDYKKQVDKFEETIKRMEMERTLYLERSKALADSTKRADKLAADSTAFADYFQKRRLENMLLIDPDTTHLSPEDSILYIKHILGKDPATYKPAKPKAKKAKKGAKDVAETDSTLTAPIDSLAQALPEELTRPLPEPPSLEQLTDSILQALPDSATESAKKQARKEAEKQAKALQKEHDRQLKERDRLIRAHNANVARQKAEADKEAARLDKEAEKAAKEAEKAAKKDKKKDDGSESAEAGEGAEGTDAPSSPSADTSSKADKAALKQQKEADKAAKAAEKEADKAAKAAEKEAKKAAKKAQKSETSTEE